MKNQKAKEPINFFSDWKKANAETWFITRSPHPDIPCYISPVDSPKCSNYSSFLPQRAMIMEIEDYLKKQVCILRYNNPDHSKYMIWSVIATRLSRWKGNEVLFRDKYYLNEMLNSILDECFIDDDYISMIPMEPTKYWYSDEILKLSGEGDSKSERAKAKRAARTAAIAEKYIEIMKSASYNYQSSNFNVKPTIQILNQKTGLSNPTIKKYGRDFYGSHRENIEQRVIGAREAYPRLTQQEIADLLGENKRTMRQYWNSVKK